MSDCKNRIASVTGIQLPFPVEVREGENLHVQLKDNHALLKPLNPPLFPAVISFSAVL